MAIPIPTSGLLTYLDFLDPTCFTSGGTAVTDLSASNNDWTISTTSYTYNSGDGSISINAGNFMSCNNLSILSGTNVPCTISFWYKPVVDSELWLFYNGGYPSNWIEIDTRTSLFIRLVDQGAYRDSTPGSIILNQYNNITVTYNGTTCEFYVNNVLYYSGSGVFNFIQDTTYPGFDFPNRYVGTACPGLALVAFYNYALTTGQRNTVYNVGYDRFFAPPPTPPLSSPGPVGGRRFGGRFNG